ncbi:P-loop containing nucleoside triphosphate hydrolase protein [Sparassis latifolia]
MARSPWSIKRIRDLVKLKFGKRACLFQVRIAQALRERENDVVSVAATGFGKTLSFWIPLLMALEDGEDKIIIIVTLPNLLGKQNVDMLRRANISGIAIDRKNATDAIFKVRTDVEAGKHRVVILNPEILMQDGGHCERLWKKPHFTSKLLHFVFDKGHCAKEWILVDVAEILQLRKGHTEHIIRSNDRPNVAISVHKMQHAACSFKDLNFLISDNFKDGDTPPPKFLVFFDNIKKAEAVVQHLCSQLPVELRDKIKHFHSVMTDHYRNDECEALKNSNIWGLCVTDSFGMGLDLADIQLIVQWKAPRNMNTLWQRFGHVGRGSGEAFAILIAEKQLFDNEIAKRERRKMQCAEKKKPGMKRKHPPTSQGDAEEHDSDASDHDDSDEEEAIPHHFQHSSHLPGIVPSTAVTPLVRILPTGMVFPTAGFEQ